MAATPQLVREELVTRAILQITGLNATAFSGNSNPTTLWQRMMAGGPDVFPLYRELLEKDWELAHAYETRKLLLLAREWKVQPAAEAGRAREIADEAARFLDAIPQFDWMLWEILDAIGFGYKVLEIIWEIRPEGIRAARVIARPQELFRFGALSEPQTGELRLARFPGGEGQPVPPAKFIVATHQPRDGDRRGLPLLRRAFWPSWIKRNVLPLWLRFLERGRGTTVVKYPSSADEAEQQLALDAARAIAQSVYAAVPEGFTLLAEALGSTRQFQAEDFNTLIGVLDAGISRIFLGQSLATRGQEQGRGAFALGEVHFDVLMEFTRQDGRIVEQVVNEQLLEPWLRWTFGEQALGRDLRPWWTVDKSPPKDLTRLLDRLTKARALGMEIPRGWAHEQTQIPQAEEGEEVLAPETATILPGLDLGPQEET